MDAFGMGVILISGALVLMVLSFLYRQSRWFTLAEHIMLGGLMGNQAAIGAQQVLNQGIKPLLAGSWWYFFALAGGFLLFAKYFKNISWYVRLPTAFLVGTGIGLNMRAGIETQITTQLYDTVRTIIAPTLTTSVNNIVIIIGVICVTLYFFFSMEAKGVLKPVTMVGRYFLMVAFGSSFAFAVLGRTSLLVSRAQDLLIYPTYYLIPIAFAVIIYDIMRNRKAS